MFQSLADIVRNTTNNTAMVWAPASGLGYPFKNTQFSPINPSKEFDELDTVADGELNSRDNPFEPFYPGDDYVDWVGLSITYPGGDVFYPAPLRNPKESLLNNILPLKPSKPFANGTFEVPIDNDILTNILPGPVNFSFGSSSFESQLLNSGTNYNFYKDFAESKEKPFLLYTGAGYLRGRTVNSEGVKELDFKQKWYSQILDENVLLKYPLVRGLIFYNSLLNITETTMNHTMLDLNTFVDYSLTNNTIVLNDFRKKIEFLINLNSTAQLRVDLAFQVKITNEN
jgi:hypothetical protein